MNKVILQGNLTRDIERYVNKDKSNKLIFTLAVSRPYSKKSDYIDLEMFVPADKVEAATKRFENTVKGSPLLVEARVENNNFTDSKGQSRYEYRFVIENISFLETKEAAIARKKRLAGASAVDAEPADVECDEFDNVGF